MIWHIFRRDFRLLWPLVATVAALCLLNAALQYTLGHFGEPRELVLIAALLPAAVLLGVAALIVTLVHQDGLLGDRQDWLVRPIRRRDLFFAKLLFVLVAVHGPILLADLAHGMATGFGFWESASAALSRGVLLLLSFSLPVLALASMTSTLVEFIGGALAIGLLILASLLAIQEFVRGGSLQPLGSSGMQWMLDAYASAVSLAAAIAAIGLQYLRRATMQARGIALGAALLVPLSQFLPWTPAFSLQQRLSSDPSAAKAVMVAFDANLEKFAVTPSQGRSDNSMWLPIRVSRLPPKSLVFDDRTHVRIIGGNGAILFDGPSINTDPVEDFPIRTATGGDVRAYERITLPEKIYELARAHPVRMELDYSLTLFRLDVADAIAALDGDKRIPGFGWCETRLDDDGDEVELGCIKPGNAPTCATAILENTVSGQRNPARNACRPDYRPYAAHLFPDAMTRIGGSLSFRDPQGLAKYPVDGSQLAKAQVFLKSYQPVAHFTRHLTIPEIRLDHWRPTAAAPAALPPSSGAD